jgi:NitT/TauT family transport system substrate-binding protein
MAKIHLMSIRHSAFYTPYLMTTAGGFLKAEGLEPAYRPATANDTVEQAFVNGTCHVTQSAIATGFLPLERGEPVKVRHFAQINDRDGFFLVSRAPMPNFSWSDLKGRVVLVDHFFQPISMLRFGMKQQGVVFDEMQVVDAGDPAAMEQAFRDGRGDLVHLQGPAAQQLAHEGLGHVVASVGEAVGPVAFSSLCAQPRWLESEMAAAFMAAYRKALNFVATAPAEELAALLRDAGFFRDIDHPVLVETLDTYKALGTWSTDPQITQERYERLLDVFSNSGVITRRYAMQDLVVAPPG